MDTKITQLPELTTAADSDLALVVHDPSGTPVDFKITKANLLKGKIDKQTPITPATKTKVTYNADGVITAGADISTSDISDFNTAVGALIASSVQYAAGTITRTAAAASGTQNISLSFQPRIVFFSALDDGDASVNCDGWDDGTIATCSSLLANNFLTTLLGALGLASLSTKSHSFSIWIQNAAGNGHQAKITAKSSSGFTLTWTKIASGRAITVKYIAF